MTGSEYTMAETIALRAYLEEMEHLLDQDAPTEVISHCRHILQHFPQNVATYRLLGKALLQKAHQDDAPELFGEAAEVFRRVLSVLPDDYVAHLGLSELSDRQGELDRAIWHLERAYEQMPGNAALQDALRELYVRRDGEDRAPTRVQLTRGALARQYFQGQLYEQAVAELRAALAHQPQRADLQALLAEALWAGQHQVEAGEVAIDLLKRLPNCLAANRIMAELWLANERPTDAQPFLDRVAALDPYVAARILKPEGDLPDTVELPRLDYYRQSQAMLSTETPGWVQELGTPGQDVSMEDLFAIPGQPGVEEALSQGTGPAQLDMAALFGEIPVPDLDTLWHEERPPDVAQSMADALSPTPDFDDSFPVPDIPWPQEKPVEESAGAEEPAIDADWILETDQPDEAEEPAESLAGWEALPQATAPDLWDTLSAESDISPGSAQPEEISGWTSPVLPEQERPEADFLDQLGEPPDFGEVDWSVFQGLSEDVGEGEVVERGLPSPEAETTDDIFSQWLDTKTPASQGADEAERLLDAALAHPDEQQLDREIDAALEDILTADELLNEAAEPISLPEWLPGPEEAHPDQDQTQPSLGDLVAALSDEQTPELPEESAALAALDESLQWLGDSLDSDGEDLLAALAAAGAQDQQVEEALAEPATELPDWIRQAAPPAEAMVSAPDVPGFPPAESDDTLAEILPTEAGISAPVEEEPELSLLADWEAIEATQVTPSDFPVETAPQEPVEGSAQAEEDWLQVFAEQLPSDQQEEPESSAEEAPVGPEIPWLETPEEETPQESYGAEQYPAAQSEEEAVYGGAEMVAGDQVSLAEPDWLAEISEEEMEPAPEADLQTLLSQPYDPFEGGSADKVPRYQAASETGILQPDERPDWMTAFLGDEVPETGELPETAQVNLDEIVTRPLYDEEFSEESAVPVSEGSAEQAEAGAPETAPADEWEVSEEATQPEGEIPEWLMAIADSEADKLSELFATDELFTLPEEAFATTEEGAQQPEQALQAEQEGLSMPETLEAFLAAEDFGLPEAEAQPLAEHLEVAPEPALSDTWAEEVSLEHQGEAAWPQADEYADEPVPEDFSFGDWVPIWLRAPLEGIPEDLPGLRGDSPPTPPEWLRDVAEEDET